MSDISKMLDSYIDALYPIIYIEHFDYRAVDRIIQDVADNREIVEFQDGQWKIINESGVPARKCDLSDFLKQIRDKGYESELLIVLKHVHNEIEAPESVSLLKDIAERNLYDEGYHACVIIVSEVVCIPRELEKLVTVFHFPVPGVSEIRDIIEEFIKDLDLTVSEDVIRKMTSAFRGLDEFQINQILRLGYQNKGSLDCGDIEFIIREKEQMIQKSGLLEVVTRRECLDDIGGLENLKEWLYKKKYVLDQLDHALDSGANIPKGVLITGMPGCGKSVMARAIANLFGCPLARLDTGRLLVQGMEELELLERLSPCVLWVDEIEKVFTRADGFGAEKFLIWLREKENTVFVVATVNDISKIPADLWGRGYFDERFYVDFPNIEERRKIMEIHLEKRKKWNPDLDILSLVKETEGYSGADLAEIVRKAVEKCFIEGRGALTTMDLKLAREETKSASCIFETRIHEIKEAAKDMDMKPAGSDKNKAALRLGSAGVAGKNEDIRVSWEMVTLYEILGKDWWKNHGANFFYKIQETDFSEESGSWGYGIELI